MPPVSVLMVFHRDTPFLRPAIASVLNQTFSDFELVLVDNGTGLSASELGPLGQDPRLRWVRLPRNEGIPGGHNAGVAAARGEYIALADYDDLLLPTRLERQVARLRRDRTLGLVSAFAERIDENERPIGHEFCLPDSSEHALYAPYAAPVITQVAMGRREVFAAYPYRSEFPFAAELDFQARVVERWRMAVLPEVLMRYRWYAQQTTRREAGLIEQSRCAIQIAAGRRKAGLVECLDSVIEGTRDRTAAATWRHGAKWCLGEGFHVFAAFQARRSYALDRTARGATRALRFALRAWREASVQDRPLVRRMFFTGPVRTLGLHPAGRESAAPTPALRSMAQAA